MASQNAVLEKINDVKAKTDRDTKTDSIKDDNILLRTSITRYMKNKRLLSLDI